MNIHRIRIALPLLLLLFTAVARAKPTTQPATQPVPNEAPLVHYWDDGVYLLNIKPYPLFASWNDGTVVCRVRGHLYLGRVPARQIMDLRDKIEAAMFFDPLLERGFSSADGPSQTINARPRAGPAKVLSHDGSYSWAQLKNVGEHANPSRAQHEAFISMWSKVVVAMEAIAPEQLTRYTGPITWRRDQR